MDRIFNRTNAKRNISIKNKWIEFRISPFLLFFIGVLAYGIFGFSYYLFKLHEDAMGIITATIIIPSAIILFFERLFVVYIFKKINLKIIWLIETVLLGIGTVLNNYYL